MPYSSLAQERYFNVNKRRLEAQGVNVNEWNAASKGKHLPKRVKKKKKPVFKVNNSLKEFGNEEGGKIEINVKKHKGDKAELADTIHHELLHKKFPEAKEKVIQKKTKIDMSKMTYAEKEALTKKVRMKKLNYKMGAAKRRVGVNRHEKVVPGDLINKFKQTRPKSQAKKVSLKKLGIMGLV